MLSAGHLGSLNPEAQASIAYVALYGDPKFDAGDGAERRKGNKPWWVQGNDKGWCTAYTIGNRQAEVCLPGERRSRLCVPRWLVKGNDKEITVTASGVLGARQPYTPSDKWRGRIGSWCDAGDLICNGTAMRLLNIGSHDSSYEDGKQKRGWITVSVPFVTESVAYTLKRLYPTSGAQPKNSANPAPTNKPLG